MKTGILVSGGKITLEVLMPEMRPYRFPDVLEVRRSFFYGMSKWQLRTLEALMVLIVMAGIILAIKKTPETRASNVQMSMSPQH